MTVKFNISLGLTDGTQMNLTSEGFKGLSYYALTFDNADAAQAAFDAIDASSLIADGFKGYHVAEIWLIAHVLVGDEIESKIVAEKSVTVDTLAA